MLSLSTAAVDLPLSNGTPLHIYVSGYLCLMGPQTEALAHAAAAGMLRWEVHP